MMQLKRRVMDPKERDDIDLALTYEERPEGGKPHMVTPAYLFNYYPPGLKERTIGANARGLVGVTRYYPMLTPKVVIDFEPAPGVNFWEDEKRRYFTEKRIVYFPIHLGDRMKIEEFKERLKAATELMYRVQAEGLENSALKAAEVGVEDWLLRPDLMALVDARAMREVDEESKAQNKRLYGAARTIVIGHRKRALLQELRDGLKNGRIVDPFECYREPAASPQ